MKKVFVTGITGLVGSAFVVELVRQRDDYEFVCLVRSGGGRTAEQRVESIIKDECAFDGCRPDLTLVFDLAPEVGLARAAARAAHIADFNDRLEEEKIDFHQRVRAGFLDIARREPSGSKFWMPHFPYRNFLNR